MDIEVKLIFSMRHSMLLVFDFEYGYHFYDSYPCIEHAIFGVFEKVVWTVTSCRTRRQVRVRARGPFYNAVIQQH